MLFKMCYSLLSLQVKTKAYACAVKQASREYADKTKPTSQLVSGSKILIRIFLFIGLMMSIPGQLTSQANGIKFLKNYGPKDYDHTPQNWEIVQAKNGMIYVANQGGVLEFDGVSWRTIRIQNWETARSIAISEDDTVYIGGTNKIGYLAPNLEGTLEYQSLLDRLKENEKNFSKVWSCHATKEGIYFRTSYLLLLWNPKIQKIKSWRSEKLLWNSFVCNGSLFVNIKQKGLFKMVGGELQLQPGADVFKENKIYFMVPYDENRNAMLIGTRTLGYFLYDGIIATPFASEIQEYLKVNELYKGIRLSSGKFALATLRGGLVIMDSTGRLLDKIDNNYGLTDNKIYNVLEDIEGNLWLGLSTGISKVEYDSPISIYHQNSGLSKLITFAKRHDKKLYAGASTGLFVFQSPFFKPTTVTQECWDMVSVGSSLFAATKKGVFFVNNDFRDKVLNESTFSIFHSKYHPEVIWCGTQFRLVGLTKKNGRWSTTYQFDTRKQEIRDILEDQNGSMWLRASSGIIFKFNFPEGLDNPEIEIYPPVKGMSKVDAIALVGGHIVFATQQGLYRFDGNKKNFVPDHILGDKYAGGSNSDPVFCILEEENKDIWFHSQSLNYHAVPNGDGTYRINSQPFRRIPTTAQVNEISPDPNGKIIWFASNEGLIRYDKTYKNYYPKPFHTLIRQVIINRHQKNEKMIFGGCRNQNKKEVTNSFPVFQYEDRNLTFKFAAPYFKAEEETLFQFFLEGYEKRWSTWDRATQRNYSNLPPGKYVFQVRAKSIYNQIGKKDTFKFEILVPWHQTWWAYLIYLTTFLLFAYLLFKWRQNFRLKYEKQKLEKMVEERTEELKGKNFQLKKQSDKLKEVDKEKSRFFTNISHEFRTPLTLIMSPAEQMKEEVDNQQHKEKLGVMLRNSQRLLTLINQLLDLSRLDSGKAKLHASKQNMVPFLKGIMASFEPLAEKRGLKIEFQANEQVIELYFDSRMMEEAMYNLLINAFKFTPDGGSITVSVTEKELETAKEGGKLKPFIFISIQDTGIGISQEQMARIFDRFYQAEEFKDKSHKGTGIGLALTKEIITLHSGIINVGSQLGEGTKFEIRLSKGREHLKDFEVVETVQPPVLRNEGELEHLIQNPEQKLPTGKDEAVAKNKDDQRPLILVVEDNEDVRKYIREPLEKNYRVLEACNGKEGVEKALKFLPDLIVSDIMMPKMDGNELCKRLKEDFETSHIPIILLTAKASEQSVVEGLETGADDYITKPFSTKILLSRIKNLIELRLQLQKTFQRQNLEIPARIKISSMDETFIRQFKEITEKNFTDPDFRIDDIMEKLDMKRSTFFKKIKVLTGENPNHFILELRLKRGKQLLDDKFGNITKIALEAGFSSSAYFTKCFKEKYGLSPSQYQSGNTAGDKETIKSE